MKIIKKIEQIKEELLFKNPIHSKKNNIWYQSVNDIFFITKWTTVIPRTNTTIDAIIHNEKLTELITNFERKLRNKFNNDKSFISGLSFNGEYPVLNIHINQDIISYFDNNKNELPQHTFDINNDYKLLIKFEGIVETGDTFIIPYYSVYQIQINEYQDINLDQLYLDSEDEEVEL